MAADTQELTFGTDVKEDLEGTAALMRQAAKQVSSAVYADALDNSDVDALDVFKEDVWGEVPQLPADLIGMMVQQQTPFSIMWLQLIEAQYGKVWRIILSVEDQIFSTLLGAEEKVRNEKLAKVCYLLTNGARSVGPFIFVERESRFSNNYRTIQAVPRTHKAVKPKNGGK